MREAEYLYRSEKLQLLANDRHVTSEETAHAREIATEIESGLNLFIPGQRSRSHGRRHRLTYL